MRTPIAYISAAIATIGLAISIFWSTDRLADALLAAPSGWLERYQGLVGTLVSVVVGFLIGLTTVGATVLIARRRDRVTLDEALLNQKIAENVAIAGLPHHLDVLARYCEDMAEYLRKTRKWNRTARTGGMKGSRPDAPTSPDGTISALADAVGILTKHGSPLVAPVIDMMHKHQIQNARKRTIEQMTENELANTMPDFLEGSCNNVMECTTLVHSWASQLITEIRLSDDRKPTPDDYYVNASKRLLNMREDLMVKA